MANIGQLYEDKNKTKPFYPKTIAEAININGITLTDIINRYILIELNTTDWVATTFNGENCYKAVKPLVGSIEETSHPLVGLSLNNQAKAQEYIEAFNLIYDAYAGNDIITFYASNKPRNNFIIQVKGW